MRSDDDDLLCWGSPEPRREKRASPKPALIPQQNADSRKPRPTWNTSSKPPLNSNAMKSRKINRKSCNGTELKMRTATLERNTSTSKSVQYNDGKSKVEQNLQEDDSKNECSGYEDVQRIIARIMGKANVAISRKEISFPEDSVTETLYEPHTDEIYEAERKLDAKTLELDIELKKVQRQKFELKLRHLEKDLAENSKARIEAIRKDEQKNFNLQVDSLRAEYEQRVSAARAFQEKIQLQIEELCSFQKEVDVRLKLARDAMKQAETQARANSERSIQIAEQKEEETIRQQLSMFLKENSPWNI